MFEDFDQLADRLLAMTPAPDDPFEPTLDPDATLVDKLVRNARLIAAAEAENMAIKAAMCQWAKTWQDTQLPESKREVAPADLVAAEIGPALHQTATTASLHVQRAVEIVTRLPGTHAAMRRGELDLGRVLAILDAILGLTDDAAAELEALVLGKAVDQNAGELRKALNQAVITVDPDAAERRRKLTIKQRGVFRYQDKDGTSNLRAVLSAIDTGEIYDLIDQTARQTRLENETRSMDARRADALVFLLTGHDPNLGPEDPPDGEPPADDPDDPEPEPEPEPEPYEPVDDATVEGAGADPFTPDPDDPGPAEPADHDQPELDQPGPFDLEARDRQLNRFDRISELAALMIATLTRRRQPRLPWVAINPTTGLDGEVVEVGELQGYGPITADYARHLLETGAARAPDPPSGREPTAQQARTHDPPGWLANDVKARDRTCRFPGCTRPVEHCDLDHTVSHSKGGLTVRANLGGLCRRHHRVKESGCWTVRQYDDGSYEWTSKITGRTYTTYPGEHTGEWRGALPG